MCVLSGDLRSDGKKRCGRESNLGPVITVNAVIPLSYTVLFFCGSGPHLCLRHPGFIVFSVGMIFLLVFLTFLSGLTAFTEAIKPENKSFTHQKSHSPAVATPAWCLPHLAACLQDGSRCVSPTHTDGRRAAYNHDTLTPSLSLSLSVCVDLFSVAFTLFSRSFLAVQPATAALYDLLVDPYIKEFSIYSLQSFYIFFLPSFLLLAVYSEIEIQTSPIGIIAVSRDHSPYVQVEFYQQYFTPILARWTSIDFLSSSCLKAMRSSKSKIGWDGGAAASFFLVVIVGVLAMLVLILLPSLVIHNMDVARHNRSQVLQNDAVHLWRQFLESSVVSEYAVAYYLEGFVFSNMRRLPSLHGPVEERLEDQFFERFPIIAKSLMTGDQEIELVALVPGGIVSQTMPHSDRFQNVDLFTVVSEALNQIIYNGGAHLGGPVKSLGDNNIYVVSVVIPVFNTTEDVSKMEDKSGILDLFWGFVFVEVDIHSLIVHSDVPQRMKELGMSYVLYSVINDEYVVLASSDYSMDQDAIAKFIDTATRVEPVNTDLQLTLAISKTRKLVVLTPSILACIVCGVGTLGVMLMALAALLIACRTKTYVGTESAPKAAPFATLVIGPLQGEELWNLLPDHMTDITEALGKVLERHMRRHRGYQIPQLQPYTTTYILRTMEEAIGMAFDVIEDIQRHPLDEDMVRTLGDNGHLLLTYGCTGAAMRKSRWSLPLVGCATRAPMCCGRDALVCREWRVEPLSSCVLRQGEPETALFTVTDLARPLLKAAQAEAEEGSLKMNDSAAKVLNPFSRERRRDSRTGFHHSTFPEAVPSKNSVNDDTRSPGEESRGPSDELGLVNNSLIEPRISTSLATALRTAFDEQGVTVEIGYDSVRVLVYYFYAFFKILFKPLAAPQRSNIYMRLITAFGLRQEALLENLAVNCTIRYLQQQEERSQYWNRQRHGERMHALCSACNDSIFSLFYVLYDRDWDQVGKPIKTERLFVFGFLNIFNF
eukprot:gene7065-5005_t